MTSRAYFEKIIKYDFRYGSPARQSDIMLLEPITRALWMQLQAAAAARGHDLRMVETLRSVARQNDCYRRGKSKLQHVGTHGYAIAFDVGLYVDGKLQEHADAYAFLPELCRPLSAISGYDWGAPGVKHSWIDADHIQRITVADQARLFAGEFYPEQDYSPYGQPIPLVDAWPGVPYALPEVPNV